MLQNGSTGVMSLNNQNNHWHAWKTENFPVRKAFCLHVKVVCSKSRHNMAEWVLIETFFVPWLLSRRRLFPEGCTVPIPETLKLTFAVPASGREGSQYPTEINQISDLYFKYIVISSRDQTVLFFPSKIGVEVWRTDLSVGIWARPYYFTRNPNTKFLRFIGHLQH